MQTPSDFTNAGYSPVSTKPPLGPVDAIWFNGSKALPGRAEYRMVAGFGGYWRDETMIDTPSYWKLVDILP